MLICQHGTTWVWCPTPWFSLSSRKLCILHCYLAPNITPGFILGFVSHSSLYQLKPYFLYLLVGTTRTMNLWFCGPGKEHALVICNHRSDIDWLVGWIMAQVSPSLSCLLCLYMSLSLDCWPI
jgi:1-acyl-sn-glycerol-3-phosphate acyltransferase